MLYEFQKKTLDQVIMALETKSIIILSSNEGTGKSTAFKNFNGIKQIGDTNFSIMKCIGSIVKKYTDYGCLPEELLDSVRSKSESKSLRNSIIKDISGTISNIIYLQTENTIDNLLSKNEKDDLEQIINHIFDKIKDMPLLFVFDAISSLDYKSHVLLYTLISQIENTQTNRIRLIIIINLEEDAELTTIRNLGLHSSVEIQTELPTVNDLKQIIDPSLYEIGRYIPIKILLDIGNQIEDIHHYLKRQLEQNVKNYILAEIILLGMAVFEKPMTLGDIILFANSYDDYEIYQTLIVLTEIKLVMKHTDTYDEYYEIDKIYRKTLLKNVPEYLLANRLQLYIQHLENSMEFFYYQKYQTYNRIYAFENACVNAVLAYCSFARELLILSGDEVITLKTFLESTHYSSLFFVIEKGYSLYCKELYNDCYILTNTYLNDNRFISDKEIFSYAYSIEFILEIIYLSALSALRVNALTTDELNCQQQYLALAIEEAKHLKNEEMILRLKEIHLLVLIELACKPAGFYFNQYFSICNEYKNKIRSANVRSRIHWETRYSMHLLRINSISQVPDKRIIINEGFEIAKRYQNCFPKLYLRAACNYACDIMWRGLYDESYRILHEAFLYIKEKDILSHWGIIFQMYTFAKIFADKDCCNILEDYDKLVWNNANIRRRMHEPLICLSNYSILLAINGLYQAAYDLIQRENQQCPKDKIYEKYILTTNLGALAYQLGNVEEAIHLETECLEMLTNTTVPNFSVPFLYKRNNVLLNIYKNKILIDQVHKSQEPQQKLSTGYCSDHYTRLMLFSDINYWAN